MKIRTSKYIIKDGLINTYRNKLMSVASISTVTVSLLVFGLFFIISVNVSKTTGDVLNRQAEIEVFCDYKWDEAQVKQIEDAIKKNNGVKEYRMVTKQEALERAKNMFEGDKKVLEGYDSSFLPISFIVKLKDPSDSAEIVKAFKKMDGVEDVNYEEAAVDFVSRLAYWVRVVSALLIVVLLIISAFIIANAIKLTVFARRREISIMKYIGATDGFIRLPFVVEGVVIGFIGALIAFAVTFLCYSTFEGKFSSGVLGINIKFVKADDIWLQVLLINVAVGMFVGGIGSLISIRKYLHV